MHDRYGKSDFWHLHMETLLREVGQAPRPNEKFLHGRQDSPLRRLARRKFQQSVLNMVSGVYLGPEREKVEEI